MQKSDLQKEIMEEMMKLMEKTGFDSFLLTTHTSDDASALEATLINLKNLNARYDKSDALVHVKTLVEKYNIQLDELLAGNRQ